MLDCELDAEWVKNQQGQRPVATLPQVEQQSLKEVAKEVQLAVGDVLDSDVRNERIGKSWL